MLFNLKYMFITIYHYTCSFHQCKYFCRSSFKSAVGGASFFIANRNVDDKEVILRLGEQCHLNVNVSLGGQTYTEANIIKIFKSFNLGEISVTPLKFLNSK